jgi:hypothetical protein
MLEKGVLARQHSFSGQQMLNSGWLIEAMPCRELRADPLSPALRGEGWSSRPKTETGPTRGPEPSESSIRDQKVYLTVPMNRSSPKGPAAKPSLVLSQ